MTQQARSMSKCELCGNEAPSGLYLPGTLARVCGRCWIRHRLDEDLQGKLAKAYHDRIFDEKGNRRENNGARTK